MARVKPSGVFCLFQLTNGTGEKEGVDELENVSQALEVPLFNLFCSVWRKV